MFSAGNGGELVRSESVGHYKGTPGTGGTEQHPERQQGQGRSTRGHDGLHCGRDRRVGPGDCRLATGFR